MSVSLTGVVAAWPEEGEALLRRVESSRSDRLIGSLLAGPEGDRARGPCRSVGLGRMAGVPVAVVVTGVGEAAARAGAEWLLRRYPVSRLISVGAASALVPGLEPEELVVSRTVERAEVPGGAGCPAPPGLTRLAVGATGGVPGVVVSPGELVLTPEAKRSLGERWGRWGARPSPAVADVEAVAFAEVGRAAGLPWICLQAVSDACDEALPELLGGCVDRAGGFQRTEVLRGALRRPSAIPGLFRLRRRLLACSEVVAEATRRLLEAWTEGEEAAPWAPRSAAAAHPRSRRTRAHGRRGSGTKNAAPTFRKARDGTRPGRVGR